jgi:hypothetical protein
MPPTVKKFDLSRNPSLTIKSYELMEEILVKKKFPVT